MKIVVFCPNLIGDTVMATPAFRALRRQFPGARLTGVIRPNVAPTLDGTAWFDELVLFHHRSARRGQRTTAIVNQLRHGRHDVAILLPNSFRAAWLAWLAGIPRRIGYSRYGRGLLLTDALQPPRDPAGTLRPVPIVEYYLALTRVLGCRHESLQLELATTADDEQAADRAWTKLGLPSDKPVVCLNTGGAFGPAKSWPGALFAALARRLADQLGVSVLVLCGPAERDAAREITSLSNHPLVVSLADEELSLGLSKACVRRSCPAGFDRLRAAPFRRGFPGSGDHALWPNPYCLDANLSSPGNPPVPAGSLRPVSKVDLPRGSSSVHARARSGKGL